MDNMRRIRAQPNPKWRWNPPATDILCRGWERRRIRLDLVGLSGKCRCGTEGRDEAPLQCSGCNNMTSVKYTEKRARARRPSLCSFNTLLKFRRGRLSGAIMGPGGARWWTTGTLPPKFFFTCTVFDKAFRIYNDNDDDKNFHFIPANAATT